MFNTTIAFISEHRYQFAIPIVTCIYVVLREFIRPIAELFIKPSLPIVCPQAGPDDAWIHEPLESAVGQEWERTTGCTLESRKATR